MSLKISNNAYSLKNNRLRLNMLFIELVFPNSTSHSFKMMFDNKPCTFYKVWHAAKPPLQKVLSCKQSIFSKWTFYSPHAENMVVPIFHGLCWNWSPKVPQNAFCNRFIAHPHEKVGNIGVLSGEHVVHVVLADLDKATIWMHCYWAVSLVPTGPAIRCF